MIAANELRIGNWVRTYPSAKIEQVYDLMCDCVNTKRKEKLPLDCIDPIELSPEILEKCGLHHYTKGSCSERYKYQEGYWSLIFSTIYLKDGGDGFSVETIAYSHEESTEIAVIKYLHQLQNLYFALCGEELNYQP